MAARFRPNRRGVGLLLRSPMVEAEMRRRAVLVKATAIALAPTGTPPGDRHPGLYRRSFRVTSTRAGGRRRDRAVAYVTNVAPYARWVEYGNGTPDAPAHHTLLRAAHSAGGG
jgi:hypothetical protein